MDHPIPQPIYHYIHPAWLPLTSTSHTTTNTSPTIRITTWNIDFQTPYKTPRTTAALHYLSQRLTDGPPGAIFLQEMEPSDLELLQRTDWVQQRFYLTDLTPQHWHGSAYGTVTLVDKRLAVRRVFRVPYSASRMQRDALFVDVALPSHPNPTISEGAYVRLCNTHLESLVSNPPLRPGQLRTAAGFMHGELGEGAAPRAAVLAGDLNAFAEEDRRAPGECGLHDAYLVLGGREGEDGGFTWGQQVPRELRERFGCSRMDKVLFCGGLVVQSLRRIGEGETVRMEYPVEEGSAVSRDSDESCGERVWVTDHLGLEAEFDVV